MVAFFHTTSVGIRLEAPSLTTTFDGVDYYGFDYTVALAGQFIPRDRFWELDFQ